jgi:hypothetical protein
VEAKGIAEDYLRDAPDPATSCEYRYFRGNDAPIGFVMLDLDDRSGSLRVSGASAAQVDAVTATVQSAVGPLNVRFGGDQQRTWAGFVMLSLGIILPLASNALPGPRGWAVAAVGLVCNLSVWLFPWTRWFPGFVVLRHDAPFYERHAGLIGFLGFLLTVGGLLATFGVWLYRRLHLS